MASTGSKGSITFDQAVDILKRELNYPGDKALHFVKMYDKNKDGLLSASEFSAFTKKVQQARDSVLPKFKEYDADGNGYITLDEASNILQRPPINFPPGMVVMLLRKFDADGNGKLDIAEFTDFYAEAKAMHEDIAERFDQLDTDRNGVLSPAEVKNCIKDMMNVDDAMADYMVRMFDANKDGSLDKIEFIQLWKSMFG